MNQWNWREIWTGTAIGALGIVVAGLLLRLVTEPVIVDQNSGRIDVLERDGRSVLERLIRLEVRHEPAPARGPALPPTHRSSNHGHP